MSNDFGPDPDFDLDDELSDELAEFDDFEADNDDLVLRTAVMLKGSMIALLCIKSAPRGAAICRVDPRESLPAVQIYDDPKAAQHWFSRSLATSQKNGWSVVYDGLPLQG